MKKISLLIVLCLVLGAWWLFSGSHLRDSIASIVNARPSIPLKIDATQTPWVVDVDLSFLERSTPKSSGSLLGALLVKHAEWLLQFFVPVKVSCQNIKWKGQNLGQAGFVVTKSAQEYQIQDIIWQAEFANLQGKGRYNNSGLQLEGKGTINDFGKIQTLLKLPVFIKSRGSYGFNVQMANVRQPLALNGTAHINLQHGHIHYQTPELNKLFVVLGTVANITRGKLPDMSQGIAFSVIDGNFIFKPFLVQNNIQAKSHYANILVTGDANLEKHSLDLLATVEANVSQIGSGALLLANPPLGMAAELLGKIGKVKPQVMVKQYYRISGPWDKPQVSLTSARAAP